MQKLRHVGIPTHFNHPEKKKKQILKEQDWCDVLKLGQDPPFIKKIVI